MAAELSRTVLEAPHGGILASERPTGTAAFSYGFRPLFLAAGSWAGIAIGLWPAMVLGYLRPPTRLAPVAWHIHEMLFGVVLAAVAGFLLTAIASWTGRRPVSGRPLGALLTLWALGRLACLLAADLPAASTSVPDLQ